MDRIIGRTTSLLLLLCTVGLLHPAGAAEDVPMKAMRDEMARSMGMQLTGLPRPYFLAYRMREITDVSVSAYLGSLVSSRDSRSRVLRVELRVGDYKLDNTNFVSFKASLDSLSNLPAGGLIARQQITIDDDYNQIRREIWLATDPAYKKAVEQLAAKEAALQNQSQADDVPDFSRERPNTYFESAKPTAVDASTLEAVARQVSLVFRQAPELRSSQVSIDVRNVYTRCINSEGTEYTKANVVTKVEIQARAQAKDGIPLEDTEKIFVNSPSELSTQDLTTRAQRIVARLQKLRTAGSFDRYNGPVLFEGEAAGEIFARVFAPALVASREPLSDNPRLLDSSVEDTSRFGAGTLNDLVGGHVLPDPVDVLDNPTIDSFQGQRLMGRYSVDDDGVPGRLNTVVRSGVLKLVLASRIPSPGSTESTGNCRGISASPSNLIVTSSKSASEQELRHMLLEHAKARGYDYGIVVRHAGLPGPTGSVMLGFSAPDNSVLEVYRVYADGHEELMHGEQLSSMPVASFKNILAVGDKPIVYNSTFLPGFTSLMNLGPNDISDITNLPIVSYVVPSLLFDEATLKKTSRSIPKEPASSPPL
jgi:PmbA/TldA metallopeptidase C-terminal domain